jgi:NAD(P)-dependent dehydrogenase (short-subunit alcohol dehydrogenase family)
VSDLSGRAAVVTGAGTGIGRAVALRLARAGARVALLGRRRAPLEAVAAEAKGGALARSVDVRERKEVERAFDDVARQLGPLHLLVANAGVGGPDVVGGEDRFDEIVRTNLDGAYFCLRAFERHLAPGPELRCAVVVSSCVARFGVPGIAAYSAAKAGQLGLVRSFAAELAPRGVRVNAICPGWVETSMAADRMREIAAELGRDYDAVRRELLAGVPLQRISEPDEIAGLVEYLCSPDAAGFTGQAFDLNNGAWMG